MTAPPPAMRIGRFDVSNASGTLFVADENMLDAIGLVDAIVKRKGVTARQTENVPYAFGLHDSYDDFSCG